MATEKTDAIVIRQADFSESSRVVTFFTREFGKISTIAKGAKRLKGPFEAALDLLARCRIVFIRKSSGGLDILTEAQLISRFTPSRRDLTSFYGGYYVAELLSGLSEEYDPHPALFDEAVTVLERLAKEPNPKLSLLRFELLLLREIGQLPPFDVCVVCGTPISPQQQSFGFSVAQGGLICQNCRRDDSSKVRVHAGSVAILRHFTGESEPAWDRLVVSPQQQQEIHHIVIALVSQLLGRRPRTLRYLNST